MIRLPIYQVDAFADKPFSGNPAAIVPLEQWLPDELMQQIAQENNLSETAFFVREPAGSDCDFHIRWFTPGIEVPLCGHASSPKAARSACGVWTMAGWSWTSRTCLLNPRRPPRRFNRASKVHRRRLFASTTIATT